MPKGNSEEDWVKELKSHVARHPICVLRLYDNEALQSARNGVRQFSLSREHDVASGISLPCICLFFDEKDRPFGGQESQPATYAAVFKAKAATTTFNSRLTFRRGVEIQPSTPAKLGELLDGSKYGKDIRKRLDKAAPLVPLGPKQSVELINKLLEIEANRGPLRVLAGGLTKPKADSIERLQVDAVTMALRAFGLAGDAPASSMNLAKDTKSGLTRMNVLEDAVIEHDARTLAGYDFISSDVRGQATFRKGSQTLEVYTANRRKLEEAFGVDLIYVNLFHRCAVLVQYKMLEPQSGSSGSTDWVYRGDKHLKKQLTTMRAFKALGARQDGFRLNSEGFFFKFVRKRDATASTSILLPLEHFEEVLADPEARTAGGNVRVSYEALDGRYMRQTAFIDLLSAGYIGTDSSTTEHLQALIKSVLSGDNALVVAVQRLTHKHEENEDRRGQLRGWGLSEDEAEIE